MNYVKGRGMISLKPYYDQDQAREELFRETLQSYATAIEALRKHISVVYPSLTNKGEEELSLLSRALSGPLTLELLAHSRTVVGQTVNRMKELAAREEEARANELLAMAKLLSTLAETFASRLNQGSAELGRFATEIEEIAACQNIQELRAKLRDRVQTMKDYVERTAQQDQETITYMESGIRALHEKMRIREVLSGLDSTTRMATGKQIALAMESAARRRERTSVILLEVSRYQLIVRRFGPVAGELVLKEFARRLGGQVKENEQTARWNEAQFAVLVDGSLDRAAERSRVLQEAVSGRYLIRADGRFIRLDICCSVAVVERQEDESMESLTARAVSQLSETSHPSTAAI